MSELPDAVSDMPDCSGSSGPQDGRWNRLKFIPEFMPPPATINEGLFGARRKKDNTSNNSNNKNNSKGSCLRVGVLRKFCLSLAILHVCLS